MENLQWWQTLWGQIRHGAKSVLFCTVSPQISPQGAYFKFRRRVGGKCAYSREVLN